MIVEKKARIKANEQVGPKHFRLSFRDRDIAAEARPGQFLMVKVAGMSPLLRRPFGVHAAENSDLAILYEVTGAGTEALSGKKAGEEIGIIGPLGRGFKVAFSRESRVVLIAGGMGVAPLHYLAQTLVLSARKNRPPLVLLGAQNKAGVLCEREFKKLGCEVMIATDDGSRGFRGYVTQLLGNIFSKSQELKAQSHMCACGPAPMLKEISRLSVLFGVPAEISLEEHMACGFGACMGCAIMTTEGPRRVCREGPVFDASSIVWDKKQPS